MKKTYPESERKIHTHATTRSIVAAAALALTVGASAQVIFTEDFTGGTSSAGFTVEQATGSCSWVYNNPSNRTFQGAGFDADFAIFDSDYCGFDAGQSEAYLVSPAFDASSANVILLSFGQVYRDLSGTTAGVEVWNGNTWTQVYNPVGASVGYPDPAVTTSLDITAAAGGSNQAKVRFRYAGDWTWYWAVDHIVVEGMDCIYPPGLTVQNITTDGAVISWNGNNSAGYEWAITEGAEPDGSNAVASGDGSNTTASGLTRNTGYTAYVRSDCGNGEFSGWSPGVSFTTLCSSTTVPYLEDFDDVTTPDLPNCVSIETIEGNPWKTLSAPVGMSGNAAYVSYTSSGAPDMESWLFTQGIELNGGVTYRLTYKFFNNSTFYTERMASAYGTSPSATAMTYLRYHDEIQTTEIQVDTIDVTPPADGVYYFGFICYSEANQFYLYLDDVRVVVSPTCESVPAVTLVEAQTDGVEFSWPASISDPADGYVWEVRADGDPGDPNPAASGSVGAGETSAIATGLMPDTEYTVYVRANCGGGDMSYWVEQPLVFHTLCLSTTIPYVEDFESVTVPEIPNCMSLETISGNPWTTVDAPFTQGFTGKVARVSYTPSNSPEMDSWLFTQGLELTGGTTYRLSYKYANYLTSYTESMAVFYGMGANAASMTEALADHPTINDYTVNTHVVEFTPDADGTYYIGFKCYSIANQYYLYLDDISVIVLENCSGTPNPGATTGPATMCAGIPFTVAFGNDPGEIGGYTYQWESSADGTTWADAPGNSTGTTYTTSITGETWYRVRMTCTGGESATSTPLQVALSPATECYCSSNFGDVSFEHITHVSFAGIDNASGGTEGGPVDYTSQVAQVAQGETVTMAVTILADANEYVYAFIDWNQNGILNDNGEVYTLAAGTTSAGPHTLAITVPADAALGTTRMRVMVAWGGSTPDPCYSGSFGEAEDYTVEVAEASAVEDCLGVPGGPALPGTPCISDAGYGGLWSNDCICIENVGIEEIAAMNGLAVHPNPASTELFITTSNGSPVRAQVFDMVGKLVMDKAGAIRLNISDLAPGTYSLVIMDEFGELMARTRFVKQ